MGRFVAKQYHNTGRGSLFKPLSDDGCGAECYTEMPSEQKDTAVCDVDQTQDSEGQAAFKAIGLYAFFATEDDVGVDWEQCFALNA